ncbi:MAG: hypothetical protein U1F43_32940 [Myxococcota bacterium]
MRITIDLDAVDPADRARAADQVTAFVDAHWGAHFKTFDDGNVSEELAKAYPRLDDENHIDLGATELSHHDRLWIDFGRDGKAAVGYSLAAMGGDLAAFRARLTAKWGAPVETSKRGDAELFVFVDAASKARYTLGPDGEPGRFSIDVARP